MTLFAPETEFDAAELVRANQGADLQISGDTPQDGADGATILSAKNIEGVIRYDPRDFTITVRAGTRLAAVENLLCENRQRLNFEPYAFDPATTIGAIVAQNTCGSRRPFSGSVKDALCAARLVTGLGEIVCVGAKVLKNTAGLDLVRLLAGSRGLFGFLTELTLRVRPIPAAEKTLVLPRVSALEFPVLIANMMRDGLPVSGAAHLCKSMSRTLIGVDAVSVVVRLEGFERCLNTCGRKTARLDWFEPEAESKNIWRAIAGAQNLFPTGQGALWRVVCPASQGGILAERMAQQGATTMIDWRGGLLWVWHPDPVTAPQIQDAITSVPMSQTRLVSGPQCAAPIRRITSGEKRFEDAMKQALDPNNTFGTRSYLQGFAVRGKQHANR